MTHTVTDLTNRFVSYFRRLLFLTDAVQCYLIIESVLMRHRSSLQNYCFPGSQLNLP